MKDGYRQIDRRGTEEILPIYYGHKPSRYKNFLKEFVDKVLDDNKVYPELVNKYFDRTKPKFEKIRGEISYSGWKNPDDEKKHREYSICFIFNKRYIRRNNDEKTDIVQKVFPFIDDGKVVVKDWGGYDELEIDGQLITEHYRNNGYVVYGLRICFDVWDDTEEDEV